MLATQPVLFCRSCGGHWSAHPGDYFMASPTSEITCQDCDEPLVLAEPIREMFVPYGKDAEIRRVIEAMWNAKGGAR